MQEDRGRKRRLLGSLGVFLGIAITSLLADQAIKDWMWAVFAREGILEIRVTSWFSLLQRTNSGVAWSWFEDHPSTLTVVTSLITLALSVYAIRSFEGLRALWPWAIIAGGSLGNIADRLRGMATGNEAAVRDFLDVHWGPNHWPTFNLADSLICVGVAFLMIFPHQPRTSHDESSTA